MNDYYTSWKLKLNPSKPEVSAFHLNNNLANIKLNIVFKVVELTHNPFPNYLGVTHDRSLTFKEHLTKTCKKLSFRINIIQKLAGVSWRANASVLRTSSMNLVYTTAEFCAPVWRNSCHSKLIDVKINHTMRIIYGTIKSTPTVWLPVLCNIAPPELRRNQATAKLLFKIKSNRVNIHLLK